MGRNAVKSIRNPRALLERDLAEEIDRHAALCEAASSHRRRKQEVCQEIAWYRHIARQHLDSLCELSRRATRAAETIKHRRERK